MRNSLLLNGLCGLLLALLLFSLTACLDLPKGLTAVRPFDPDRYLGRWYEIVRLDHSFERGMEQVTAEYSHRADGGIRVLNRGWNPRTGTWKKAEGKAFPLGEPSEGRLKVSFFGPFYAAYNVIALDEQGYSWALVCGPTRKYFWILARTPHLPPELLEGLLERARAMGFPTERVIRVKQEPPPA